MRPHAWAWVGPPPASRTAPGRVWLYQLLVEPEARGQGLGRATLDALHARLRREGAREAWLNVHETNAGARRLYRACGYSTVARYGGSRHMRRPL